MQHLEADDGGGHLLRDFQAMIDRGGASEAIGSRLKTSGQELIHHWNRLCDEQIKRPTCQFAG